MSSIFFEEVHSCEAVILARHNEELYHQQEERYQCKGLILFVIVGIYG